MKRLFNKIKRFEHKHAHTLTRWSGTMMVLVAIAVFVGSGAPSTVKAWIITIWPSYTPVYTGGNTTISWRTTNADYCIIRGPTHFSGETCYSTPIIISQGPCDAYGNCPEPVYQRDASGNIMYSPPSCYLMVNGVNGSAYTGPINAPYTYNIYCHNVSGGWGSSEGNGNTTIIVYPTTPTPTTLTSFTASPASVVSGSASTLAWTGTRGTFYSACLLTGGQWGAGTWFSAHPGSVATNALTANTTYNMNCYDTNGTATGWRSATVNVTAVSDVCTNITGNQATPPANGTTSGGVCSCNAGYTLQGSSCVATPDVCTNIAGTQATPPANGSTSGGVCSCNAGYSLQGTSCVVVASCTGAHQLGTPPNCTCEVGYQMQAGVCVQVACPGANEVNWPTCSCASGYSRDGVTNTCIREPVLSIAVNGLDTTRVRKGNTVTVTWSASGVVAGSCRTTTNSGTTIGTTDTGSANPTVANQTIYRLSCTNDAGSSVSREAIVNLIPEVNEQ